MIILTEQEMIEKLSFTLKPSRFKHSLGVRDTAVLLAKHYGADCEKARLAGLLHDCAKNMAFEDSIKYCRENHYRLKEVCFFEPTLIHAPLGSLMAQREYGVTDPEVLDAIYYHTTGHENMPLLTKIIYLADTIEPNRTQAGVEQLRVTAFESLDEALIRAIDATVRHIINKGGILDTDTVAARNYLITERKNVEK